MRQLSLIFGAFLLLSNVSLANDTPSESQNLETSMVETQKELIVRVFNELRSDNLHILDEFYAKEAHFLDPIGEHRGLEAIKNYYKNLYRNVQEIRFEFTDLIAEGENHSATWTMYLKAKGLNSGNEVTLKGTSIIKFKDGLVVYHRDYFDMGEFIYDHIPVLNWLISQVKARLKS